MATKGNEISPERKEKVAGTESQTIIEKGDPRHPRAVLLEEKKMATAWKDRQDFWVFIFGILFIGILTGMIFAVGEARHWDAPSGFVHNETSSKDRFLPEPDTPEPGVRGRYGEGASGRWYYWKVPTPQITVWTRFFPWMCYVGHQILIWGSIYFAQCAKAMEPLGRKRYTTNMRMFNWFALATNVIFHILHFINTHSTYDGLAQDVSVSSSQGSVIMLLVLVLMIEYKDRGMLMGWPTAAGSTRQCSTRAIMPMGPVHLVRKYHGYAFAWAAVYTFWYHPMENTAGHVMGFFHTWIILLQGSLMYTDMHLNVYWRLLNEMWVLLHAGVVASQTGGPELKGTKLWPMFVFGFALVLVITQIFSLPFWRKAPMGVHVIPLAVYLGVALWCYSWIPDSEGRTWIRLQEIIRIPAIYYIFFVVGWALLLGFLAAEKKLKSNPSAVASTPGKRAGYLIAAIVTYAVMIAVSILIEYLDWQQDLVMIMIVLVAIFTLGSTVSFILLKQAIPNKWKSSTGEETIILNGIYSEDKLLQHNGSVGGQNNVGYSEHL